MTTFIVSCPCPCGVRFPVDSETMRVGEPKHVCPLGDPECNCVWAGGPDDAA
jgi:hypothetical protein